MKKMLRKISLLIFSIYLISSGQVKAFDYMADVDEVSKDPYKAYTLYCEMPWSDVKQNFTGLMGWMNFYKMDANDISLMKITDTDSSVKECVYIHYLPDEYFRGIRSYYILFAVDSFEIADRIYKRIYNNISQKLVKTNNDYLVQIPNAIKSEMWKTAFDEVDIRVIVYISKLSDEFKNMYFHNNELQSKSAYCCVIERTLTDNRCYLGLPIKPGMEKEACEYYDKKRGH